MYLDVSNQGLQFIYSLLLGTGLGIIYEVFRILRIAFNFKNIAIFIQDLVYFFIISPIIFVFLLNTTYGKVRIYILVGTFLGFLLYYFTLGVFVRKISVLIIGFIKLCLEKICRYIFTPIFKFIQFIFMSIKKLLKHLQNRLKIVYNKNVYKYHLPANHRRRNYFGRKEKKNKTQT